MASERITLLDVAISIGGKIVAGVESVEIEWKRENKDVHEAGNYDPAEIVDGPKSYSGSIGASFLDTTTINLICPPDQARWPYFTLTGRIASGKLANGRNVTVIDCKCDSGKISGWDLAGGHAKNDLPFKARGLKFD